MPIATITGISTVIDDLLLRNTDREKAEVKLESLPLTDYEHKSAKAFSALITKLPSMPSEEIINEFDICTRFLDLFLSALLDKPDNDIYFRWTKETALESKARPDLSRDRPDI
ncbi:uncharacterized protein EV154DRAFT_597977 [Mucor mucedo]|uniref:uncharacterized protein n=1 Tax=Mucor mucedo TaxID=29922 RepID=UPI002221229B|nr:uncharacterized protein EV154DRAFT_597977 [Mucor mucedo]KAI7896729.1 hypothetical protein EV154DRAFT_597977 [Mucor mucedo]